MLQILATYNFSKSVKLMLAREPASFWRENVVAVVILLRVLASVVVAKTS